MDSYSKYTIVLIVIIIDHGRKYSRSYNCIKNNHRTNFSSFLDTG